MRRKRRATPVASKRSAWVMLALALAPGCLGGQTGEPSSDLAGTCWPASVFPDPQLRVWTDDLNGLELRPNTWAHPEDLPLHLTASVNEEASACRASATRTDWWVELTLVSPQGAVFSQNTQVLAENVECAGCFRLHLTTIAEVENPALIFGTEEADEVSEARAELNATVVGNANAVPMISGNLTVHYQRDTSPGLEQSRSFAF